jgi:hypothetical protein
MPGDQLSVPAEQGRRRDKERRPARAGQQSRQGGQQHPVGRLESGTVHLAAQHRHLMRNTRISTSLAPPSRAIWLSICKTWRSSKYTSDAVMASIVSAAPAPSMCRTADQPV